MKVYHLHRAQFIPITIEQAWKFFSAPANLQKITPANMGFKVISEIEDVEMYEGMEIEYIIKPLFGIPMHWLTIIRKVNKPVSFTDVQKKGPYKLWEHTHTFTEMAGGVMMTDDVRYALPLGMLGRVAHGLMVKKRLKDIFDFRTKTLKQYFGE